MSQVVFVAQYSGRYLEDRRNERRPADLIGDVIHNHAGCDGIGRRRVQEDLLGRCTGGQGLSCVCDDFRFRHRGRVDVGLPDNSRVDAGMLLLEPFGQESAMRCSSPVPWQRSTIRSASRKCLGDPVVEREVFGRPLPMFAQLVAVVQMMQEMMRIVGLDRFAMLIRGKVNAVQLRAVMINHRHDVHGIRFGRRRRAVRIFGRSPSRCEIVAELVDLARVQMFAVRLVKDEVLAVYSQGIFSVRFFLR